VASAGISAPVNNPRKSALSAKSPKSGLNGSCNYPFYYFADPHEISVRFACAGSQESGIITLNIREFMLLITVCHYPLKIIYTNPAGMFPILI
jgi:hypothetical protein